ncbi:MAG: glycerol-3-phosphate dehydrogenase [Leptolyngbyaceae bacterium]|nr:glycerol-3-phosphate dehydrogenase [Leptolyngbyaceae bacterium]
MRNLQTVQDTEFDLIIIGGGINGVGIARDAALRGLRTVLIEKGDFASGTTSWSTRLIHGGLRYLEYFEFNLVRESLREREILLKTAPHLVHPVQLTIPIYTYGSRSYWEIKAGMMLYDILSYDKTVPSHRMLPKPQLQQLFRGVQPEELTGGAQYYDGQAERAERLCWENVLAAKDAGATMLNYVKATQLHRSGDRLTHLTCRDELSGEVFDIRGTDKAVVVNTSGPWVDEVCGLGEPNEIGQTRKMGGTKGSHIIVDHFPGAPETAFYVEAKADNRPFFIVPWLGLYLIGTTDLHYEGKLDNLKADDDEVDYLLAETNRIFPSARLGRDDVKFTYSGVRPLPYAGDKKPGSITRSHILFDHAPEGVSNMISLIGGKLTTFRQVGEEMVDAAYKKMGVPAPECKTRHTPFPGAIADADPKVQAIFTQYEGTLHATQIEHLFKTYGSKTEEVLALVDDAPDLAERIVPYCPDIKAQAVYAVQSEMAYTLEDICRRRTTLSMHANYGFDALPGVVDALKRHCGWSEEECDRQIANYHRFINKNCLPDYAMESPAESETVSSAA